LRRTDVSHQRLIGRKLRGTETVQMQIIQILSISIFLRSKQRQNNNQHFSWNKQSEILLNKNASFSSSCLDEQVIHRFK
jgi:hypothetical protein